VEGQTSYETPAYQTGRQNTKKVLEVFSRFKKCASILMSEILNIFDYIKKVDVIESVFN
jgi:hypothetical protein